MSCYRNKAISFILSKVSIFPKHFMFHSVKAVASQGKLYLKIPIKGELQYIVKKYEESEDKTLC